MIVIVSGKIEHSELLKVVEKFEDDVLSQTPPNFERPFMTPVPEIERKVSKTILCPSDDDTQGTIQIAWLGPNASVILRLYFGTI